MRSASPSRGPRPGARRVCSAIEDAGLAEDVAEAGNPLARHSRQLVADHRFDVGVGAVRPAAEFGRHGVGAEERGHELDRPLAVQPADDLELAQLGGAVQAVARFGLGRGAAVAQHLSARRGRGSASSSSEAARVAATVERIPPPAARISR